MKPTLFSDESDLEEDTAANSHELHINKNYATTYESFRKKEELQKLKDRESQLKEYDSDNGDSSDDSSDNDLSKPTTQALDLLASTLLAIKSGDAKKDFLAAEKDCTNGHLISADKKKKEKMEDIYVTHRQETNGNISEEEEVISDDEEELSFPEEEHSPELSLQFIAGHDLVTDNGTANTEVSQSSGLTSKSEALNERLEQAFHRPNMTKEDEWLANFFMKQRHQLADPSDSEDELHHRGHRRPSHRTTESNMHGFIYEDQPEETRRTMRETLASFGGEGPSLEQQRHKSFPAVLESTVRIKDDKRRKRRLKDAERKAAEKLRLRQEVQQLQAIKRKEIQERLQKIQQISGQTRLAFSEADLDEDFDPDNYDRKMQEAYGDMYYDDSADGKKPVFEYDENIDADIPDYDGYQVHGDDEAEGDEESKFPSSGAPTDSFLNKEDYPEEHDAEAPCPSTEGSSCRRRRKKRKTDQLSQALQRKKPLFDPEHDDYDKYFDDYYALNFEDVIAGGEIKCRFKYKQVEPNNFGLSTEEILMADDKELNKWCSLKKIIKVDRTTYQEEQDRKVYRAKGQNIAFKKKMLPTIYKPPQEELDTETIIDESAVQRAEEEKKKRKNLKKKLRKQRRLEEQSTEQQNTADVEENECVKQDSSMKSERKRESEEKEKGDEEDQSVKKSVHSSTTVHMAKKSKADDLHKFNKKMKQKRQQEEARLQTEGAASEQKFVQRKARKELVVGDAFSTVLKLSDERLAAYSISGLSKIKKQARYQEKVAERGTAANTWKQSHEKTNKNKNKDKNTSKNIKNTKRKNQ